MTLKSIWRLTFDLALTAVLLLMPAVALAQQQNEFRPARPEDFGREALPATPFVFVAYALVWLLLVGYVFVLWRRLGRIERDLADVNARLKAASKA